MVHGGCFIVVVYCRGPTIPQALHKGQTGHFAKAEVHVSAANTGQMIPDEVGDQVGQNLKLSLPIAYGNICLPTFRDVRHYGATFLPIGVECGLDRHGPRRLAFAHHCHLAGLFGLGLK